MCVCSFSILFKYMHLLYENVCKNEKYDNKNEPNFGNPQMVYEFLFRLFLISAYLF